MGYAVLLLLIRRLIVRIVDNSSTGLSDGPRLSDGPTSIGPSDNPAVKKWHTNRTNTEAILVSNQVYGGLLVYLPAFLDSALGRAEY